MTLTTLSQSEVLSLQNTLAGNIYHLMQRVEDRRNYRRTVGELASLSSEQLADLGLHRSEIKRAAREAVYGV